MTAIEGDRVRFCRECKLNVYNRSAMTQAEAEGLLRGHEGRLCVRYYQRRDGTILTQNCPVGAQAVRLKIMRQSTAAALCYATSQSIQGAPVGDDVAPSPPLRKSPPQVQVVEAKPQHDGHVMGMVSLPKVEMSEVANWKTQPGTAQEHDAGSERERRLHPQETTGVSVRAKSEPKPVLPK